MAEISAAEGQSTHRLTLVRGSKRGTLARRKNDTMGIERRRLLIAARDEVQALLTQHGPQTCSPGDQPHYFSVSIGVPPPRNGRRMFFFGYYPILVESNDPGVLAWARERFCAGIGGMPVSVLERPPQVPQSRVGACLSHVYDHDRFGTLGCYVHRQGQLLGLTAAHAVSTPQGAVALQDVVVCPSNARRPFLRRKTVLGTIECIETHLDACLINIDPALHTSACNDIPLRHGSKHLRRLTLNGLPEAEGQDGKVEWDNGWAVLGLRVAKVGAATGGYRIGHVREVEKSITFEDGQTLGRVFTVRSSDGRPFSENGDSGSVVFEDSGRRPVGLLIASNGQDSACVEFNNILYECEVNLA